MKAMSIAQFQLDYNEIVNANLTREDKVTQLHSYIQHNWSILPRFYEGHSMKKLRWFPKEIPHWCNGDKNTFLFRQRYYSDLKYLLNNIEVYIDPIQAIGNTWLFASFGEDGKPLPERLSNILLGTPEELPDVFAQRAKEYYVCNDGNHRIYAAYLLGRRVKVSFNSEFACVYDSLGNLCK